MESISVQNAIKIDVGKGFKTGPVFDSFLVAKMDPQRAAKSEFKRFHRLEDGNVKRIVLESARDATHTNAYEK